MPPAESGVGVVSRTERAEGEAGDSEVRLCEPTALDDAPETALGASGLAPETALGASGLAPETALGTSGLAPETALGASEVLARVVTRPVAKWSMRTCHQTSS